MGLDLLNSSEAGLRLNTHTLEYDSISRRIVLRKEVSKYMKVSVYL